MAEISKLERAVDQHPVAVTIAALGTAGLLSTAYFASDFESNVVGSLRDQVGCVENYIGQYGQEDPSGKVVVEAPAPEVSESCSGAMREIIARAFVDESLRDQVVSIQDGRFVVDEHNVAEATVFEVRDALKEDLSQAQNNELGHAAWQTIKLGWKLAPAVMIVGWLGRVTGEGFTLPGWLSRKSGRNSGFSEQAQQPAAGTAEATTDEPSDRGAAELGSDDTAELGEFTEHATRGLGQTPEAMENVSPENPSLIDDVNWRGEKRGESRRRGRRRR
jgi:hypothetical protein